MRIQVFSKRKRSRMMVICKMDCVKIRLQYIVTLFFMLSYFF